MLFVSLLLAPWWWAAKPCRRTGRSSSSIRRFAPAHWASHPPESMNTRLKRENGKWSKERTWMVVDSPRQHVLTCGFVGQGTPLAHWTATLLWCSSKDRSSRSIALHTTEYYSLETTLAGPPTSRCSHHAVPLPRPSIESGWCVVGARRCQ